MAGQNEGNKVKKNKTTTDSVDDVLNAAAAAVDEVDAVGVEGTVADADGAAEPVRPAVGVGHELGTVALDHLADLRRPRSAVDVDVPAPASLGRRRRLWRLRRRLGGRRRPPGGRRRRLWGLRRRLWGLRRRPGGRGRRPGAPGRWFRPRSVGRVRVRPSVEDGRFRTRSRRRLGADRRRRVAAVDDGVGPNLGLVDSVDAVDAGRRQIGLADEAVALADLTRDPPRRITCVRRVWL